MKTSSFKKVFIVFSGVLIFSLIGASLLAAQTQQAASQKDEKFYIYSIEQLSAANKGLQEQLVQNQRLITRLRTENDSLISVLRKYQSGGLTAAAPAKMKSVITSPARTPVAAASGDFEERYRMALAKFNQVDYKQAKTMFKNLLMQNRNHSLSDNCQYWIGESHYALKEYQQAIIEFEKVLTFADTNKDDDAQLKLGLCYLRLNDNASAKRELTRLIANYPKSEFTELGRKLLEEI
ncbi:MAG: tetratricopeptide repeat protein [FCB group bacterium]|nr:tetratricopeptide repeat protein [FCB group bacterium]